MKNIDEAMAATRLTISYHKGGVDVVAKREDIAQILQINYCIIGLIGEAGEIANKWKKFFRGDTDLDTVKRQVADENGDTLWYLLRLYDELGLVPSEEVYKLFAKLQDRKARDVVKGSGDER